MDEKATIRLHDKKKEVEDPSDPYTLPHNIEANKAKCERVNKRGPYRTAKNNFGLGCSDCTSITCKYNQFQKNLNLSNRQLTTQEKRLQKQIEKARSKNQFGSCMKDQDFQRVRKHLHSEDSHYNRHDEPPRQEPAQTVSDLDKECIYCIAKRIWLNTNAKLVSSSKISSRMQRLDATEPNPEFQTTASKLFVVKNIKANTRSVSVRDKEMKESLNQSLPTTAESCTVKKPDARSEEQKSKQRTELFESLQPIRQKPD